MLPDAAGGTQVLVAAGQPEGVQKEHWLRVIQGDDGINRVPRVYVPDLETFDTWKAPQAEQVKANQQRRRTQLQAKLDL